jgi:hypothetical protein
VIPQFICGLSYGPLIESAVWYYGSILGGIMSSNNDVMGREHRTRELMKRLRHSVNTLSVNRLLNRLDYGDRVLLEKLLEDLIR